MLTGNYKLPSCRVAEARRPVARRSAGGVFCGESHGRVARSDPGGGRL